MKKLIKKFLHLFFKGAYAVGYRECTDSENLITGNKTCFNVIEPTLSKWYADPFPFVYEGKKYIFVEICDDRNDEKGTIGVCDLSNGSRFVEIINEPFHMSFPNVFVFNNKIYMMPETSGAHQLRLYESVEFPYKWKLASVLLENIDVVDTVILKTEQNTLWAIGQKLPSKSNVLFEIDMVNLFGVVHSLSGEFLDKRPAGNFLKIREKTVHTLQECGKVYGEYLHVCELSEFSNTKLCEKDIGKITVEDVKTDSSKKYRRIHTYNKVDGIEVIDLLYYQFNPMILWNKVSKIIKNS